MKEYGKQKGQGLDIMLEKPCAKREFRMNGFMFPLGRMVVLDKF